MINSAAGRTGEYLSAVTSSFAEFASRVAPELVTSRLGAEAVGPHGTTIVAATFANGVIMAGDRRATTGNVIAQRDIEKVFSADDFSVIGVAGVAGLATEVVRLFKVELEHFEKVEGTPLSLDGKANRLASMIRANLPMALQGLAVLPLFAGWDADRGHGRIFSYDGAGGRYEETSFHAVGSGAAFARGALKKIYRADLDERGAVMAVVQSLFDAADDDAATGGPDITRGIFPVVISAGPGGVHHLKADEVAELTELVLAGRVARPDGPQAGLV